MSKQAHHRVEFVPGSQRIEVVVDGVTVANTTSPLLVQETSHPVRYYIPETDVNRQYLEPVSTTSHCPYKGDADYYNVVVNGATYENVAWAYPDPIPDASRLKGTIAFWPEKDRRIQLTVDGKKSEALQTRPDVVDGTE